MNSTNRVKIIIKILIIIVFIINICTNFFVYSYNTVLIENDAQQYINNLLLSYNSLVKFYETKKLNFENYEHHFSLYREEGKSFKVIFVKAEHKDNESINMMFSSIQSDYPEIIIDFDHSLDDYFPNFAILKGTWSTLKGGLIEYLDMNIYVDFIVSLQLNEILDNTLINSKKLADFLYLKDINNVRIDRIERIWAPFVEENKEIIWENNRLRELSFTIRNNILWNESYTYEIFINEFNTFGIVVTHYKDKSFMIEEYNKFLNSAQINEIDVKEDTEIYNKLMNIKYNVESNELYLYENFESNLQELENIIIIELQKQALAEERQTLAEIRQALAEVRQARAEDRRYAIFLAVITTIVGYYFNSWMRARRGKLSP